MNYRIFFLPVFIFFSLSFSLAGNQLSDTVRRGPQLTDTNHTVQHSPDTIYSMLEFEELVVTATKTERDNFEIPSRISVINHEMLKLSSSGQIDDILRFTPGVNVNRGAGMYTQRPMVTVRGLSGDEQSRTLVLMNGVPLNTSDEGGVNWNRINHYDIEKVEVFKGPGSSLYGNNAMGGVINLITKTPSEPVEVFSGVGYGRYNTLRQDLNVRVRSEEGYYGALSQFYLQSDGYNSIPPEERTPHDRKRFLEEMGVSARLGYDQSKWLNWEIQYDVFRDKRGEGFQVFAPDGCYRNFNTNLIRGNLKGGDEKTSYNMNAYYQLENYYDINENMREGNYSRFDVDSDREDMGLLFNISRELGENNTLTGGFEYKRGSIKGGDYYQTEPYDTVYNEGVISSVAGYIQNEHSFMDDRVRLLGGLRLDRVTFSDGEYYSTDPWSTIPELTSNTWMKLSPRAGLRFNFIENFSAYLSWSHGFRASILDDLTRTGWMWVGPKYANPELEPESIVNYETGFDIYPTDHMKVSASAYLMQGEDFLYYVATDDSIYGRTIFRRENVTDVRVRGIETEIEFTPAKGISIMGGYSYNDSRIASFEERPGLEGNYLKYVPGHNASLSVFWENRLADFSVRSVYKGRQFGDDANQVKLDGYVTLDLVVSRTFQERYVVSLDVQNIFDNRYMETIDYMSPGRLITGRVELKF